MNYLFGLNSDEDSEINILKNASSAITVEIEKTFKRLECDVRYYK